MQHRLCCMLSFLGVLIFISVTVASSEERRETGEVKSYRGVTLGSVNDFIENSIGGVRKVNLAKYRLRIDGLVKKPLSYSYQELKTFPRRKKLVTTHCVEGWSVTVLWEGIPIGEWIGRAGVDPKVNTIIFHGEIGRAHV